MAHLEQIIRDYMNKNAHIRLSYAQGLINRRELARQIIKEDKSLSRSQFEAIISTLRRANLAKEPQNEKGKDSDGSHNFTILIKDGITIANLSKSRDAISQIEKILPKISYEKNQTFKIVIGSESIKLFLDSKNKGLIDIYVQRKDILYTKDGLAEISLNYPEPASSSKGILAYISTTLSMHGIIIEELLTCSPELLIYVNGPDSLKAYKILKEMQIK